MAPQYEPADRAAPDIDPEAGWRRYSVEPSGNGYALAATIVGSIGVLEGVNIWTIGLMFFGALDLFLAPMLGLAAVLLAWEAPAAPGRRLRLAGFVTGGIALALGVATFVGIGS